MPIKVIRWEQLWSVRLKKFYGKMNEFSRQLILFFLQNLPSFFLKLFPSRLKLVRKNLFSKTEFSLFQIAGVAYILSLSLSQAPITFPKFILAGERIVVRNSQAGEKSWCGENSSGRAASTDIASTMTGEGTNFHKFRF